MEYFAGIFKCTVHIWSNFAQSTCVFVCFSFALNEKKLSMKSVTPQNDANVEIHEQKAQKPYERNVLGGSSVKGREEAPKHF